MANNYLNFSEVLNHLNEDEAAWLRGQLEVVYVFGDEEFPEDEIPDRLRGVEPDWYGARTWRDMDGYDPDDGELVGFEYQFAEDTDWGRYLWIYAEEWGNVDHVAHFVQKFLKKFRPDRWWSLQYALTCSKLRVGSLGGGAVFVTASEIKQDSTFAFVDRCHQEFEAAQVPTI